MMKTKILLVAGFLLCTFSCKKDTAPSIDLQKGLVSYFNFDTNFKDQQGYFSDGVGFPSFVPLKFGSALSFNGTTQKLLISPLAPKTSTQFSISVWLNIVPTGNKIIVGQSQSVENFFINYASGTLFIYLKTNDDKIGGVKIDNFNPYTNKWVYLTCTYDGKVINLYLNGELKQSDSTYLYKTILDQNYTFGYSVSDGYSPFYMDELRLYDRALSQAEVTQLYNLK